MKNLLLAFCLWLLIATGLLAQKPVSITILYDGDRGSNLFLDLVEEEVKALLPLEDSIQFNKVVLNQPGKTPAATIQEVFQGDTDVLVALGFQASGALNAIGDYPIPCIAGISVQQFESESTGINNYNVIQSPFSIPRDFEVFQSIYPFKHLGIFIIPGLENGLSNYFSRFADGFDIQFIPISDSPEADIQQLNANIDAVYLLPNLYDSEDKYQALVDGINTQKLPSFSLRGRDDVERGVLAAISSSDYINVYARRIALNVMKILEGQNAKDFPIRLDGIEEDFVINVGTMEQIEVYPSFDVLSQASMINMIPQLGKKYSLQSAIAEALANNLSYQSAAQNVDIQQTEIGIARANLLPAIDAASTLSTVDSKTAESLKSANQLNPQTSWTGNLKLTQLVYSQSAWANIAIQKALLRSEEANLLSQQLDLALNVATAYLRCLQAQANLSIQNNNVQTSLSNLNIAKTKAKIGTVSNADVYGFESQLALNRTTLADAATSLEQARIAFNQLLNRPLDEDFTLDDVKMTDDILFLQDSRVGGQVNNYNDFREFSAFLTSYALQNAPEIEQLQWAIKAQEHALGINQKGRYLPQLALQGNLDKTLGRYGIKTPDEIFQAAGLDPYRPTWNIGLNASLPLFQGNLRNKNIQKSKIQLHQLDINRAALEQQLAMSIRVSLENLANSYSDIALTAQAEESSTRYLNIVQDLYREGVANIVNLLDAQQNALSSQLGVVSTRYQFMIDAITIERTFNNIYLLASQEERESFIQAYIDFIIKKEDND